MDSPFDRLAALYDPEALAEKTVVCVGVGGARSYLENLARCGVRRFVLLDPDIVELPNVATQGVFQEETGRNKVDCVAESLRRINPTIQVCAEARALDDRLSDADFEALAGPCLLERPRDVLIAGCTDSFYAQARSANLALQYGTPYLAAQLYQGGLAAELYFSYPGVTRGGCPRCAMSGRYEAYLKNGYVNRVTSAGASVFVTERVNALKGQISLLLLLYGAAGGGRYATLLERVAMRNFVLLRLAPEAGEALGLPVFSRLDGRYACFDETLWLPQKPDAPGSGAPPCPLCGGEADLGRLAGTLGDTRILR